MSRNHIIRIVLSCLFIVLAIIIATYEHFFDIVPSDGLGLPSIETAATVASCDPDIAEKLMAEEPLHIRSGDTLSHVLKCANIPSTQVHSVINALRKDFNPRNLKPQHEIAITTAPSEKEGERELLSLSIRPTFEEEIIVAQQEDGTYKSEKKKRNIKQEVKIAQGMIESSLYMDAAQQGVPNKILHEMIRVLSYQIDFQRNVKSGDGFEVMYEVQTDEDSKNTVAGDLVYACLKLNGSPVYIYRYKHKDGDIGFYNENGESIKKAILQTPVDGARISSGYGNRKHPILGYTKLHKGVDFAVPIGAPIMAAGDGVVEKAGWFGGYGKYVRLRHSGNFKTAYAHLSRFAKGLHVGKRVKQGDIIAFSGSTGSSTGPHLHYEVLRGDRQINPRSIKKIPGTSKLNGDVLRQFKQEKSQLDKLYLALANPLDSKTQLAQAQNRGEKS